MKYLLFQFEGENNPMHTIHLDLQKLLELEPVVSVIRFTGPHALLIAAPVNHV